MALGCQPDKLTIKYTNMKPTIGRIVVYTLSEEDAQQINRRRTTGKDISDRIKEDKWPLGAQAHIGERVYGDGKDVLPLIITRVKFSNPDTPDDCVSGKVLLNGSDFLFVEGVRMLGIEGTPETGCWHWPAREPGRIELPKPTRAALDNVLCEQLPLPRYRCHKEVYASKILSVREDGKALQTEHGEALISPEWTTLRCVDKNNQPLSAVGGYFVVYDNSYTSWSPADAFEAGYSPLGANEGAETINPGDTVYLKGGGPGLNVENVRGSHADCSWFNGGEIRRETLLVSCLTKANPAAIVCTHTSH